MAASPTPRRRRGVSDQLHLRDVLAGDERQQRGGLAGKVSTRARSSWATASTQGTLKNALPFASARTRDPDGRKPAAGERWGRSAACAARIARLAPAQRSVPVANGVDARLIEAEAKLQANDITG